MQVLAALMILTACSLCAAAIDPFGIAELYPTRTKGVEYFSKSWWNAHPRDFKDSPDPGDPWFDASHGSGSYHIDGAGFLKADGDIVRLYVHNPNLESEWGENLEITVYYSRLSEKKRVSYSGPQIFARSNHGTFTGSFGGESRTLCDDRGLGAKINLDGAWAFEKETCHGADKGYATAGYVKHWPGGFPVAVLVGVKYILRNRKGLDGKTEVLMELYEDLRGGINGGDWKKVTETVDRGTFGKGSTPCREGVDPALVHVRENLLEASETQRPELCVYFRHEYAAMLYRNLSIREIDPAPDAKAVK